MNFKNLLAKVVNLIFKYILSSYFIGDWRCSNIRWAWLTCAEAIKMLGASRRRLTDNRFHLNTKTHHPG